MSRRFSHLAGWVARTSGHWLAFFLATLVIAGWAATGPFFGYSTTWQLVINTGTTIVTFLMVFLIQHEQNHDGHALHLKLDELLRTQQDADNRLIDIEEDQDEELHDLDRTYHGLHAQGKEGTKHP